MNELPKYGTKTRIGCFCNESSILKYTDFNWDGVHFLHSSWNTAMFWICAGSRVHILAIAEQCLHTVKAFFAPVFRAALPANRLGCTRS